LARFGVQGSDGLRFRADGQPAVEVPALLLDVSDS